MPWITVAVSFALETQADDATRNRYVSDGVIKWKEVEQDVPQASKNSWNSASVLHERKHLEKKIRSNEHGVPHSKSYALRFVLTDGLFWLNSFCSASQDSRTSP
eukprot:SAG31_NODE_439_length_15675_cov_6.578390_14_plen_104_part_00